VGLYCEKKPDRWTTESRQRHDPGTTNLTEATIAPGKDETLSIKTADRGRARGSEQRHDQIQAHGPELISAVADEHQNVWYSSRKQMKSD